MSYAPAPETSSRVRQLILRLVAKLDPGGVADLMELVGQMDRLPPGCFCEEMQPSPEEMEECGLPPMTRRQREVAEFIYRYRQENGHNPDLRWLAKVFDVRHQSIIAILKALEAKGYVRHGGRGAWALTPEGSVPLELATEDQNAGEAPSRSTWARSVCPEAPVAPQAGSRSGAGRTVRPARVDIESRD